MREALISATEGALRCVDAARFFQTERGFQGRFYCALQAELDRIDLMRNGAILEMEYQKSTRHGTFQRPDIVFHIPVEHSGCEATSGNFAVWALKRRASTVGAYEDFEKLDEMFSSLAYPLGFFLNIDASDPMHQHYRGRYRDRVVTFAARLVDCQINLTKGAPSWEI